MCCASGSWTRSVREASPLEQCLRSCRELESCCHAADWIAARRDCRCIKGLGVARVLDLLGAAWRRASHRAGDRSVNTMQPAGTLVLTHVRRSRSLAADTGGAGCSFLRATMPASVSHSRPPRCPRTHEMIGAIASDSSKSPSVMQVCCTRLAGAGTGSSCSRWAGWTSQPSRRQPTTRSETGNNQSLSLLRPIAKTHKPSRTLGEL